MASPDPLLNIRLRMLDDDSEDPEEFAALDAIFNSQETSEEIKTNVFALKQKFSKLQLSYASHLHVCKQNSEANAQEMENLTTKQQDLQEDVRAAHKYIEELQRNIINLEMKTSMGNQSLWDDFETMNRDYHKMKEDLETKSDLLRDYHVYSANIQDRNSYLEVKCAELHEKLGISEHTAVEKKEEPDWQIDESATMDETIPECIEPTSSTSSVRTESEMNDLKMDVLKLHATAFEYEQELKDVKNKLDEFKTKLDEGECVNYDNKKLREEKRILQSEMDATNRNLSTTENQLESAKKELLEAKEKLIALERDKTLKAENTNEELRVLQIENENLLIKVNKLTKSGKFLENYYKEKIKTTMATIKNVVHPILNELITLHNKSKSENDLMLKQSFSNDEGTTHGSLSNLTQSTPVRTLAEENQEAKKSERNKYDAVKIELTDANTKITQLTTECDRLKEQIIELNNNKSKLEKLNLSLDNHVEVLFKENEKVIAELEILKELTKFETITQPGDADTKISREVLYKKIEAELSAKMSERQAAQSVIEEIPERMDTSEATTSTGVLTLQTAPVQEQKSVETEMEIDDGDTNVELNQKLRQTEQALKDSKKVEQSVKCKNEILVNMLQDSIKIQENTQSKIAVLNDEIKTLWIRIFELEEEANTAKINCQNEKENSKSAQSDLRKQQECLEIKLRDCKSERDRFLETITEGNRKLQILEETNKALQNAKKKLEEEKERIDRQNSVFFSQVIALKEKIEKESENSLRIQNDNLANKQRVDELNTLVTELTSERDQLKINNGSNENKRDLQAKNHMLELTLENVEIEMQSSIANYSIKIKALEDEKNSLAAEKLQLQTALQSSEEKLMIEKSAHLKSLTSVEGDRQLLYYQLTLENTVLQSENKVLNAKIKDQEEAIKKGKATVDKYKTELTWQRDVFNNHEKRIRLLKAECLEKDKLETELEDKEVRIQDCLERIKQLNSSLDEAGDTVREHQAENSDIKAKLIQALSNENRMQELLEEMNNKIENFKSSITETIQHLEYVQYTFAPPSSAMQEEEEPNLANMLAIIRTNLVHILEDLREPASTESGTNISEMLENLQQKETELAQVKRQITELDSNYTAVFEELQTLKSQQESEALLKECAQCVKLTERISDLESRINMLESNEVSDEIVQSYRDHCDYLTKRIKHLEKEKQKLNVQPPQSSETQYTNYLTSELLVMKNKYDKLKIVAHMRFTEIQELKSRLGYDPGQGCSTDP